MNCHKLEADVVDLARGGWLSEAARQRVNEHLGRCPDCAAAFAREQHLTAVLKTLASSAPQRGRSSEIEQALLRAYAARQATVPGRISRSRRALATPSAWRWLAAAALLVLAVVTGQGTARWRPAGPTRPGPTEATARPAVRRPAEPTRAGAGGTTSVAARPPRAEAGRPDAPGLVPPSRQRATRAAPAGDDQVLRFVELPAAAGLPPLESGRIVRVELPVGLLPAYGFDVAPDPGAGVVEADVLVGQDGQPRAIRFVSPDSDRRRTP